MKFMFPSCGGCTSCEMACSYLKSGEFNRHLSAIEVTIGADGGYEVELLEEKTGERFACDGCIDRDEPMCIKYCHDAQKLRECIDKQREKLDEKKEGK